MTDNPFELVLDRLREKGWTQGRFGGREGPNCIREAGWYVTNNVYQFEGNLNDRRSPLIGIIMDQYPKRVPDLAYREITSYFNDHPDTTFEDVERVLEKAAVKWEEERVLRND